MACLQSLEWAQLEPAQVGALISIAATGRHPAGCVAWSEAQRLALAIGPKFNGGNYDPLDPPAAGLATARAVAMVTYRCPVSLGGRCGRYSGKEIFAERSVAPDDLAVRGCLRYHGKAFAHRFDANTYLRLIDAMDTHDIVSLVPGGE